MEKREVELANVEINEYCLLSLETKKIVYYDKPKQNGFTGLYFKNEKDFFGIYPTLIGPIVFYKGNEYPINRNLSIILKKEGTKRRFIISEYQIEIIYLESKYIDFDVWSTEVDVDIFYMIEQNYKSDAFYKKYTKN